MGEQDLASTTCSTREQETRSAPCCEMGFTREQETRPDICTLLSDGLHQGIGNEADHWVYG